uniref:Ninja-family protein n=1 Tax=Noccaea caerulescens TaxID=107243 RepID=A0A1J3CGV1_NOCCA
MDDDTGLELSLGLSCGGSSGKAKGNSNTNNAGSSSENHRVEGGDRSAKVIDDFKNFLHPTSQRPSEPSSGSQRSDCGQQPPQNFFNDLSKAPTNDGEASTKPLWVEEDETRIEAGNKRKFGFPGMNDEKKKEMDSSSHVVDLHEKKTKASHVSTATDEGSTAENEDVADSEVGGGGGSSSNLAKDMTRPNADTNIVDNLAGQRKSSHVGSSAEEFTIRNMSSYTVPFTAHHPQNVVTSLPYSAKESGQHAAATSLMQPTASPGNLPIMFGYSPVQLPMLDKDGASGIVALSQSPFAGRGPSNSATAKGEGKQPVAEEGSSEDASERPTGENNNNNNSSNAAVSFDFSAIKPGMAADVKFGGSGARPNLPWVSTTGSGPHGRTISGVTYRYNANQIKIVCACHGSHMSPEEFVRHASEEYVSPESSIGMAAASAHT